MKNNVIFKFIKEFLLGTVQVVFGSVETNFGIALFFLLAGIVFLIIPDAEKPAVFYLFAALCLLLSFRLFYKGAKEIINKNKKEF